MSAYSGLKPSISANSTKSSATPAALVVDRSATILECFGRPKSWMSLQEVADAAQLSKPTAFRLLSALSAEQLIIQDDATGEYGLGPAVTRFAESVLRKMPVWRATQGAMQHLRDRINETVLLSVRRGANWYNVEALPAAHSLSLAQPMGVPLPLHVGAPGISFLTGMTEVERAQYLNEPGFDTGSRCAITSSIGAAERQGYAISVGDILPDCIAMAAHIVIGPTKNTGVLQVSFPKARDSETLRAVVREELRLACDAVMSA
ncbi:MAG: IclR family transcriptional regulator [Hyphomicrobiales bacterium]|nr:IclR family transcriptional regulator [Hyphomicrobiales bacterium]